MALSDYNGDFSFTIGGNSFHKTAPSGGKNVYSRTGSGSGGSSGPGDSFPILGDTSGALVVDDTIFIIEGDQGGGANWSLSQYTFPDMVLVDVIDPVRNDSTDSNLANSGYSEWNNTEMNMTADWFGATSSAIDIYFQQGNQTVRYSKFTYNRNTRTCSAVTYIGHEDNHGWSSENSRIIGIKDSGISGKPNILLSRSYMDNLSHRRYTVCPYLEWNASAATPQYVANPQSSSYLPSFILGPYSHIDPNVTIPNSYQDVSYMNIAGINPWTGRLYMKVNGFIDGIEVWQIDASHKPADNNYVGGVRSISGVTTVSPTGKMSYVKNIEMPLSAMNTDSTGRNRNDISFNIETQEPSWVFQPGRRGDRDAQFGSIAKWNPAWT